MPRPRLARLVPSPIAAARLWLVAVVLAAAVVAAVQAQAPPAEAKTSAPPASPEAEAALAADQKLIAQAKDGSEIMPNLTYLSDVIGPRLTGSDNLKRANEWVAEKMMRYGLSNIRLEPWTIPVGWERGTASARLIEPNTGQTLTIAAAGWSPGTKGKVEGDVVIVRAQSKEELAKFKGKLKNAIILQAPPSNVRPITDLTYNSPSRGAPRAPGGRGGEGRGGTPPAGNTPPAGGPPGESIFGRGGRGAEVSEFLRAEGAAAVLRDSAKPHGLLNMSGGWPRGADRANAGEPIPSLFITHDHYALLWRLASRPAPARTRVELEVTNKFIPGPLTVYNTVGEIRGSEKPDEFIVVGAHLDSWDLGQGTTDNGTGTCVVLEAARILMKSGVKPKRTIRFVLFSGEEEGLHGSRAFVNAHKEDMARTSLAIIHDTGTGKVVGIRTQGREALKPIFDRELVSLKELGVKEINLQRTTGSDQVSFEAVGVPGTQLQQDPAEYRFTHHSQSDTLDKAREPDLIQSAQVMAITALRVANLDSLLPRQGGAGRRGGGN